MTVEAHVRILREPLLSFSDMQADPSVVSWSDRRPLNGWQRSLPSKTVKLSIAGTQLTVILGVDFVPRSHYALRVELVSDKPHDGASVEMQRRSLGGDLVVASRSHIRDIDDGTDDISRDVGGASG